MNLLSEHSVSVEEKFLLTIVVSIGKHLKTFKTMIWESKVIDKATLSRDLAKPETGGDGGVLVDVDAQVAKLLVLRRHRLAI